jgi:UDP-N-acetylglucosamine 2-epimerase (non-hydrolysing)
LHRQENVDSKKTFTEILEGLKKISEKVKLPIIFPMHPRTNKMVTKFKLRLPQGIIAIKPVGFLDSLWLQANARLVLSDSGGMQEETCILRVPCVTLRNNTERSQTIEVGANIIAGTKPQGIFKAALAMLERRQSWRNPFGDGKTAERILKAILN